MGLFRGTDVSSGAATGHVVTGNIGDGSSTAAFSVTGAVTLVGGEGRCLLNLACSTAARSVAIGASPASAEASSLVIGVYVGAGPRSTGTVVLTRARVGLGGDERLAFSPNRRTR